MVVIKRFLYVFFILCTILLVACSTKKNTLVSRTYHASTSKYNILYNGQLAYDKGIQTLEEKAQDDFNTILSVEKIQATELDEIIKKDKDPNFQRAEEKAIKAAQLHSIYVSGAENNPQMDRAYMLLGKSRYHDLRYVPAIEAFNYVTMKYPDSDLFYDALVWTEKTNLRLKYDELAIKNLKKVLKDEKLKGQTRSDAHATLAQGYININALDSAVVSLEKAILFSSTSELKNRYKFILGQLHSRLTNKQEAVRVFSEIIKDNNRSQRAYVIHSYAGRLQNSSLQLSDSLATLKEFKNLLKDRENRKFKDVVYHQIGLVYQQFKNNSKAIEYYNRSLKAIKNNPFLKFANFNQMANIYYETHQYAQAGKFLDSTMVYMNPLSKEYLKVKRKRNGLLDLIRLEKIRTQNDSVLSLLSMTKTQQVAFFEKSIEKQKALKKQKEKNQSTSSNGSLPVLLGANSNFYFYSETAKAKGMQDFRKKWGDRALVDNWRWVNQSSQKSASDSLSENKDVANKSQVTNDLKTPEITPEFHIEQLPKNERQITQLKKDRDVAYYQLGVLYFDRLAELQLASQRLEKLLTLSPDKSLIEPAKYYLYKIYLALNDSKAKDLLADLKKNHPESTYTKVLINASDKSLTHEKPTMQYDRVFTNFQSGNYKQVLDSLQEIIPSVVNGELLTKYEMLKATALGKLNGLKDYEKSLEFVALTYPNAKEGIEAKRILTKDLPKLKQKNFTFDLTRNLKMIYKIEDVSSAESKLLKQKLEDYAKSNAHQGLIFSIDVYSDKSVFYVLHGIKSGNLAHSGKIYLELEKNYQIKQMPTLISTDDYIVVLFKKNWEDYLKQRQEQEQLQENLQKKQADKNTEN